MLYSHDTAKCRLGCVSHVLSKWKRLKGNRCCGILSNTMRGMSFFSPINSVTCVIGCHGSGHIGLRLKQTVRNIVLHCPRVVIKHIANKQLGTSG